MCFVLNIFSLQQKIDPPKTENKSGDPVLSINVPKMTFPIMQQSPKIRKDKPTATVEAPTLVWNINPNINKRQKSHLKPFTRPCD